MKRMLIFILSVCLFSCGQEQKPLIIPANILPQQKMAQVLTDIHIAEAEINLNSPPDSASKMTTDFEKTFTKDSITKQQYEESLNFYMDHPQLLDTVYVQALNELSKMQGEGK